MLRKLMKYEFLATGRQILPAYMGVVLFAAINRVLLEVGGGFEQFWDGTVTTTPLANIVFGFLILFYILAIFAVAVLTTVLIIRRFHTNLFKDEGYLANTLPVSADTHIWGKLIPAACWSIASIIVVIVSFIIIFSGEMAPYWDIIGWHYTWAVMLVDVISLLLGLLYSLVLLLAGILSFYSALSIGQLAKQRKILLAIGAFLGMSFVFSLIFTGIQEVLTETLYNSSRSYLAILTGIALVQGAIHYCITRYILKNKLNLE